MTEAQRSKLFMQLKELGKPYIWLENRVGTVLSKWTKGMASEYIGQLEKIIVKQREGGGIPTIQQDEEEEGGHVEDLFPGEPKL
jgi:hypothetical protein